MEKQPTDNDIKQDQVGTKRPREEAELVDSDQGPPATPVSIQDELKKARKTLKKTSRKITSLTQRYADFAEIYQKEVKQEAIDAAPDNPPPGSDTETLLLSKMKNLRKGLQRNQQESLKTEEAIKKLETQLEEVPPQPPVTKRHKKVSTNEVLLQNLLDWCKKKGIIKQGSYKIPHHLSPSCFDPIERDDLLADTLKCFARRWRYSAQDHSTLMISTENKNKNEIVGVHSSPGIGKSFALTLIALLGHDEEKLKNLNKDKNIGLTEQEITQIMRSVGLTVTLNSAFSRLDAETEENWHEFFAWRILCSYFCSNSQFSPGKNLAGTFESFVKRFSANHEMDSFKALEIIMLHQEQLNNGEKVPIILCVDEVMLSVNPKALLRQLGKILDAYPNVLIAFSTLDYSYVAQHSEFTASSRLLSWMHLPPISLQGAMKMFSWFNPSELPEVSRTIFMANGHARSLQTIGQRLIEILMASTSDIFNTLTATMSQRNIELTWEMIKIALLNRPIPPDHPFHVDSAEKTANQLVMEGYFLNSHKSTEASFVPRLSLLSIQAYLLAKSPENQKYEPLRKLVALAAPPLEDAARGVWLESFLSLWESLARLLLEETGPTETSFSLLNGLYRINQYPTDNVQNHFSKYGCALVHGNDVTIKMPFYPDRPPKRIEKKWNGLTEDSFNVIYQLGGNTAGFDSMILEKTTEGQPIAIFLEYKYSSIKNPKESSGKLIPAKASDLDVSDIRKKILSSVQTFRDLFLALPDKTKESPSEDVDQAQDSAPIPKFTSVSQLYIVFVSLMEIPPGTVGNLKKALSGEPKGEHAPFVRSLNGPPFPNIVVITRKHIMELLSPTLSYIPEFDPELTFTETLTTGNLPSGNASSNQ